MVDFLPLTLSLSLVFSFGPESKQCFGFPYQLIPPPRQPLILIYYFLDYFEAHGVGGVDEGRGGGLRSLGEEEATSGGFMGVSSGHRCQFLWSHVNQLTHNDA